MCSHKTETAGHRHSACSIYYQHIATTSAFHVLFKIMRSDSRRPIEGEQSFLPLKRHVSRKGERMQSAEETEGRKGKKQRKRGKWVEYMTEVDGDVTYFLPPSEDFWWPNPSYTVHHSATFASRPSKGQAGRRYITITHLLEKQYHRSAEGASREYQRSHTLKQVLQHNINLFVCNVIMFLLLSRIQYEFTDYLESDAIMQYEAVKK